MTVGVLIGAGDVATASAARLAGSVDRIVAIDVDPQRLKRLVARHGPTVSTVLGDINEDQTWSNSAAAVLECGLPVAWTILTAGVGARGTLETLDHDVVRRVFSTNVVSPILMLQTLLTRCQWALGARIIGLGSISARRPLPERTVYGATKAALEAFLTALGAELAPRGIAVNLVSAGVIDSEFIAAARQDLRTWATERVPAGRLGTVEEVADVIAFLATAAPDYLTAARIVVDGGAEARA